MARTVQKARHKNQNALEDITVVILLQWKFVELGHSVHLVAGNHYHVQKDFIVQDKVLSPLLAYQEHTVQVTQLNHNLVLLDIIVKAPTI